MSELDPVFAKQLHEALLDAFPRQSDLEQMLFFGMGLKLYHVTGGSTLSELVFNLIGWAQAHSRVQLLIKAALVANPDNHKLKSLPDSAQQTLTQSQQSLLSYLFVDNHELQSYSEQIIGNNVSSFTNHDKITRLLTHLRETGDIDEKRTSSYGEGRAFCHEICKARKVLFPSTMLDSLPDGITDLALWISPEPEPELIIGSDAGPLFLFESYRSGGGTWTSYSALHYMLHDLNIRIRRYLVADHESHGGWFTPEERRFETDPFIYLSELGAYISDIRWIECLYVRRATMYGLGVGKYMTFGYPIFIAARPDKPL